MSRLKNFLEKLKKKSKLEIIKSLFQSFSVTVVAVVAVVVFVPNSPKANFDNVKVFSHEIIYQVTVTDEDNAIEGNPLKIVLEDQFGKQEQLISLGQNYGSFSSLKPLTEYKLKVVYDKGFGEEVLAQETVKTDTDLIAAITNFSSYQDPMMQEEHYFIYNLEIAYGNIEGYTNFSLRYTTVFPEYPDESYYEYYPLSENETSAQLYFYGSYGAVFQIFLEADFEGQTVIVDEIIMNVPFNLSGSFYIDYFNNNEISFYTFVNHIENIEEIECFIDLYQAETLVKSIEYIPEDIETTEEIPIVIDGLEPVTDYTLVLRANYINPDTLKKEEKNVYSFSFTTLKNSVAEITNFTQYIDPYFEEQYISIYNVGIAYGKTSGYSDFQLRYATINPMYPDETYYEIYPLTYLNTIAQLQFYNAHEAKYHLVLEATFNGEMVIIDEVEVDAPFMVSGSMYINTIDATEVLIDIYDAYDYPNGPTVTYSIDLYQATTLIETITYLPVEQSVLISNLEPLTSYQLVLRANYINPDTSIAEEKILSEVSFTTTSNQPASITSFTQFIDPQNQEPYILFYDVLISYQDTTDYTDFQIRYATIDPNYPLEAYYEIYSLLTNETQVQLQFYNAYGSTYHIILEAVFESQLVIVDEIEVPAPFIPSGMIFTNYIDATEVLLDVYDVYEYPNGPSVTYSVDVYQDGNLVDTVVYNPQEITLLITNLTPLTDYLLIFRANYIDPDTSIPEEKNLSELNLTTATDIVASITSFTQYIDPQNPNDYISIYDVVIAYENTLGYSDFKLSYGTIDPKYPLETYYEIYPLLSLETQAQLTFYNTNGAQYHLILEAVYDTQTVIIDEILIDAPFAVFGSMYFEYYNDIEAAVSPYDLYQIPTGPDITYSLELYEGVTLINSLVYTPPDQEPSVQTAAIFYQLIPLTNYTILLKANYINPDTLIPEEKILSELNFTTLEDIFADAFYIDNGTSYDVTVTAMNNILDMAYYEIYAYDSLNDSWYLIDSQSFTLVLEGNSYTATFIINKPVEETYVIFLGVESSTIFEQQKQLNIIESMVIPNEPA